MAHQYEYQLTVTCVDPECSDEGLEIYSITTESRELATPETIQVMRAEEKHEEAEQDFQDFETHHKMAREDS